MDRDEREDANPQHMKVFVDTIRKGYNQYSKPWSESEVHLGTLAA